MYQTNRLPDTRLILETGKEYLYFGGTDYLGMSHNTEFREYLLEGMALFGTHYGSSRNNSLQLKIYEEAENLLAKHTGAPAALTVSSGMWAGQLGHKMIEDIVSGRHISQDIKYHYAPNLHPALWGKGYSATRLAWGQWAQETVEAVAAQAHCPHIICTDSVGSPWVEQYDLALFSQIPKSDNVWLILDDSHGIGVVGEGGIGSYPAIRNHFRFNLIVVSSLNKGMGVPAGVRLSEEAVIQHFRNSPWFAGASPSAPAYLFALKKFIEHRHYTNLTASLRSNIRHFNQLFDTSNLFAGIVDYPVYCSKSTALFQFLEGNGVMGSCFAYPRAINPKVTRIALSALHQKNDLDRLAEVCISFQNEDRQ